VDGNKGIGQEGYVYKSLEFVVTQWASAGYKWLF